MIKVKPAHSLTLAWNRISENEGSIYQDDYKDHCVIIPHFGYCRPVIWETKKKEDRI